MNQEIKLYRIAMLLSRFTEHVNILNSNMEFSINIHAENALISILNIVYDCNLVNVNYEEGKTYPSIDLRDDEKRVAFQITATGSMSKIKHTVTEYVKHRLHKKYDKLYIFIINRKNNNYNQTVMNSITKEFLLTKDNILDRNDLYLAINKTNDFTKIESILSILEKQFSDINFSNKWETYADGILEYDNSVIERFKNLEIRGFSPRIINKEVGVQLEDLYVEVNLVKENDTNDDNYSMTIENIIENNQRIIILGDPGSGKSTILKHIAYEYCSKRSLYSEIIPLYIRCPDYAKKYELAYMGLGEYIIDGLNKKFENIFLDALEKGRLFLLLDGLDEINNINLRHNIIENIYSFLAENNLYKIIITSRKVGYAEARLNNSFSHYEIINLNHEQIERFVKNWYESIYTSHDLDEDRLGMIDNTFYNIVSNRSVMELAKNPLLLTIICLIDYKGISLPQKRVELYDIATATLLDNWVARRGVGNYKKATKDILVELLAPIAYYIHENYDNGLITEKEFKNLFYESYKAIATSSISLISNIDLDKQIYDMINYIKSETGFIVEKGIDIKGNSLFGFIHLTFQEYLASIELIERLKKNFDFNKILFNPYWHEIIVISGEQVGMGKRYIDSINAVSEYVSKILNAKDDFPIKKRPLCIVLDIMCDDVEISEELFLSILNNLQIDLEGNSLYSTRFSLDTYFVKLLNTSVYSTSVLNFLLDNINNIKYTAKIVDILMESSGVESVKESIIEIISKNNENLNYLFYDYKTVFPLAPVIHSEYYKQRIIDYTNNSEDSEDIPSQYIYSILETNTLFDGYNENTIDNLIRGIKYLKDKDKKNLFAQMAVSSILWNNDDQRLEFVKALKDDKSLLVDYKEVEREFKELYPDLREYDALIKFKDEELLFYNPDNKEFSFKNNNQKIKYPIKSENLVNKIKVRNIEDFTEFVNLLAKYHQNWTNYKIKSDKVLKQWGKYYKIFLWSAIPRDISLVLVKYLLEQKKYTLNYINNYYIHFLNVCRNIYPSKLNLSYSNDKIITYIKNCDLESYKKIVILALIGKREDYEDLLKDVLEGYENGSSKELSEILFIV